jgi:hypothetical protein
VSECHREYNGTTSGYCTKKMICLSYDDNLNDTDLWTFKKHACMHACTYANIYIFVVYHHPRWWSHHLRTIRHR